MDSIGNPFAPGAGTQPPELAGRDQLLDDAKVAIGRVKHGRSSRSQILLGLRGVGKTVLLNTIRDLADKDGYKTIVLEAPEERRLAEMLVPPLRTLLFSLSRVDRAKDLAKRGLGVLRAFAGAFKVTAGDVEFGVQAEAGAADSGDLEADLPQLFLAASEAAKAAATPIALLIDEVQYLSSADLGALITAIHKVGQRGLPFIFFGAGLPQLAALAGEAKSYAERLFLYPDVGPLGPEAAREAIRAPVEEAGERITEDALALIATRTRGFPYFLQEWGFHAWKTADASPITRDHVEEASVNAIQQLDQGFFRVRLDRLTPREKEYMRAMASLGPGPHTSGDIAKVLRILVTAAGPPRNALIKKGMIFSPQHGETAFTVPMFDEFMTRTMPSWSPGGTMPTPKKRPPRRGGKR